MSQSSQAVLDSASPPNLQHQKCMVPTLHAESHSFVIAVLCRCGRSFSNAFRCIRSSGLSLGLHKFMIPLHWHARILLSVGIGIRRVVRVKQTNAFKIASGQCGSRMPLVFEILLQDATASESDSASVKKERIGTKLQLCLPHRSCGIFDLSSGSILQICNAIPMAR